MEEGEDWGWESLITKRGNGDVEGIRKVHNEHGSGFSHSTIHLWEEGKDGKE